MPTFETNLKSPISIKKLFLDLFTFIAWAVLIFWSSSQPYTKQNLRPTMENYNLSFVDKLFSWVNFTYSDTVISIESLGTTHFIEFFIRKAAHLVVFMILVILTYRVIRHWTERIAVRANAAFMFVAIYAALDEYRHLLHPDRTGLIEDVILDCLGGLIGIGIYVFVNKKTLKTKKRNVRNIRIV